jgi:NADPH-dependent glutamate synthase beta subunit-like oxidoreductase
VAIRALKRTATARFGVESAHGAAAWHAAHGPVPPATLPSVAIVGAGPAGLAAAHDLRLAGHRVVIHEASDRAGGMMALGIPAFRLPRTLLDAEIAAILSLGVELHLNSAVGRDVTLDSLLAEHAAVFIASGCGRGRELDVPGRELRGVTVAVEYLLDVNRGAPPAIGEHVVVIGGGSVAFDAARMAVRSGDTAPSPGLHTSLDAARAAKRAGSREVTIIALESREELPADAAELAAAEAEGIRIRFRTAVTRIDGSTDVTGVTLTPVRRVYDARGQFAPELETAAASDALACDTVIVAVGQRAESGFVSESLQVPRTGFGGLVVDRATGRTAHPRLRACSSRPWRTASVRRRASVRRSAACRNACRRSTPSSRRRRSRGAGRRTSTASRAPSSPTTSRHQTARTPKSSCRSATSMPNTRARAACAASSR